MKRKTMVAAGKRTAAGKPQILVYLTPDGRRTLERIAAHLTEIDNGAVRYSLSSVVELAIREYAKTLGVED